MTYAPLGSSAIRYFFSFRILLAKPTAFVAITDKTPASLQLLLESLVAPLGMKCPRAELVSASTKANDFSTLIAAHTEKL